MARNVKGTGNVALIKGVDDAKIAI